MVELVFGFGTSGGSGGGSGDPPGDPEGVWEFETSPGVWASMALAPEGWHHLHLGAGRHAYIFPDERAVYAGVVNSSNVHYEPLQSDLRFRQVDTGTEYDLFPSQDYEPTFKHFISTGGMYSRKISGGLYLPLDVFNPSWAESRMATAMEAEEDTIEALNLGPYKPNWAQWDGGLNTSHGGWGIPPNFWWRMGGPTGVQAVEAQMVGWSHRTKHLLLNPDGTFNDVLQNKDAGGSYWYGRDIHGNPAVDNWVPELDPGDVVYGDSIPVGAASYAFSVYNYVDPPYTHHSRMLRGPVMMAKAGCLFAKWCLRAQWSDALKWLNGSDDTHLFQKERWSLQHYMDDEPNGQGAPWAARQMYHTHLLFMSVYPHLTPAEQTEWYDRFLNAYVDHRFPLNGIYVAQGSYPETDASAAAGSSSGPYYAMWQEDLIHSGLGFLQLDAATQAYRNARKFGIEGQNGENAIIKYGEARNTGDLLSVGNSLKQPMQGDMAIWHHENFAHYGQLLFWLPEFHDYTQAQFWYSVEGPPDTFATYVDRVPLIDGGNGHYMEMMDNIPLPNTWDWIPEGIDLGL